ncbi:uncharacterized protein LOC107633882 [Arachis ipaensis]|uniref:uncharacterized protein LOC107633882 n=1 Tax=Arachis ipaensis TaxID=130454 RepID=UPI0007AFC0A8|nr:uncharacterized protein LOC107633882 [Arachis ipaensis]XP_025640928.1 uncharacterized protein LOC112735616 [Arachis hypogaea]
MQEIQNVAREYINDEEVSQVMGANKRQLAYSSVCPPGSGERSKEHSKDGAPAKTFKPFARIADKGILSKPRQLKDRTGRNKNLYCDYHKGYGHKTQDCFDLKDALEQAIREGKLDEFSHLIREPRRRDHDRSNEDKGHTVKQRREPEENNERGLIVVNVVVGRDAPPRSKSASKKDAKVLAMSSGSMPSARRVPSISFGPEDQWVDDVTENPPMVITARVGTGIVKRILVDTGADSNIMFCNVFDALGLRDTDLRGHQHGVVSLGDNFIKPDGIVSLPIFIGGGRGKRSLMAEFVVLRDSTAYNLILGRITINEFGAVICTKLLLMKFVADDGSIPMHRPDEEKTTFITQRGVEANPEKCEAILQIKSPRCVKEVQRLAGRLTALSRLLGASAAKALPFFYK